MVLEFLKKTPSGVRFLDSTTIIPLSSLFSIELFGKKTKNN
jgi:hypothetical protein